MKIIKTEAEYDMALERLEEIFDALPDTPEGEEAELLSLLIENYEEEHHRIDPPDPIEAIKIRMEEMDLLQKDLVGVIGTKSLVSDVLNRKRKLSLKMIRSLSEKLNLTAQILIQDYQLHK